ncbi:unnamed protein product [Peniophora sp. CBMAI 1063]|nr:unnamed protein product [Peniophora sp. CBMAI 1063]
MAPAHSRIVEVSIYLNQFISPALPSTCEAACATEDLRCDLPNPRRTRSGRGFSAYQPETIEAPIDYALLLKHAVEVQLEQVDDDWSHSHGTLHMDLPPHHPTPSPRPSRPPSPLTPLARSPSPSAPPPPPSPSPSRSSTVYVMELDELVSGIAQTEAAASNAAGRKRPASGPDSGDEAGAGPAKKQRKRSEADKLKKKEASKRRLKAKRAAHVASGELPIRRPADAKHGAKPDIEKPARDNIAHAFDVDKWGYGAINGGSIKSRPWRAGDLDAEGVRYVEWDGKSTKVILDAKRRIVAVLLARPKECADEAGKTSWDHTMERLAALFDRIRREHEGQWSGEDHNGRRGKFTSFGFGSSFGGGQAARDLRKDGWQAEVTKELREHPDLQRLARWGSEGFAKFFPKAYAFAANIMRQLLGRGDITRNFPGSVYAASTCNLGPRTVCLDHTDHLNYPGIPCVITGFGDYNPDEGGDLFLLNFGLRIRFPPGSTAILSSAGVRHGNTPVPDGQTRYSFTQYTAGGLVRWVSMGFRKATGMNVAERVRIDGAPGSNWEEQLARLSVYEELQVDRAALVTKSGG